MQNSLKFNDLCQRLSPEQDRVSFNLFFRIDKYCGFLVITPEFSVMLLHFLRHKLDTPDHPLLDPRCSSMHLPGILEEGDNILKKAFVFGSTVVRLGDVSASHETDPDSWALNPYLTRTTVNSHTTGVPSNLYQPSKYPIFDPERLQFEEPMGHRRSTQVGSMMGL